jgi:hypothetical protein
VRLAPLPQAAERSGVRTLHPLPFCGAERQVRVEPDPHAGVAVDVPEYSILSPEFCGGETLAALALVLMDSRGIKKAASSTPGYGSLIRLSEVLELSTP